MAFSWWHLVLTAARECETRFVWLNIEPTLVTCSVPKLWNSKQSPFWIIWPQCDPPSLLPPQRCPWSNNCKHLETCQAKDLTTRSCHPKKPKHCWLFADCFSTDSTRKNNTIQFCPVPSKSPFRRKVAWGNYPVQPEKTAKTTWQSIGCHNEKWCACEVSKRRERLRLHWVIFEAWHRFKKHDLVK